jgi:hypothetical protein
MGRIIQLQAYLAIGKTLEPGIVQEALVTIIHFPTMRWVILPLPSTMISFTLPIIPLS